MRLYGRSFRRAAAVTPVACLVVACATQPDGGTAPAAADQPTTESRRCMDRGLCFVTVQTDRQIEVWMETYGDRTITVAFNAYATGMRGEAPELSLIASGETRRRLMHLKEPSDRDGSEWNWFYRFNYHIGSETREHDDGYIYRLPYRPGQVYRVTQGFNGNSTHRGGLRYAIDWAMPTGTHVLAARGGTIVGLREDSGNVGNWNNNYIWIEHDDGTIGHYFHLQKDGALVDMGQTVKAGDLIGLSGNTGRSLSPHLHYHVSTSARGRDAFKTFPIRFRTTDGEAEVLSLGRSYEAPGVQPSN